MSSTMDITAALKSLSNRTQSQVVELRGDKGEKGDRGDVGPSGHDAAPVQIKIGVVLTAKEGEEAQARIRKDNKDSGDNCFILDLALPKGATGNRGPIGLQSEVPGPQGKPGEKPTRDEIAQVVHQAINENREAFRGLRGEVGATGADAPSVTGNEIEQAVRFVLADMREELRGPQGLPGHSVDEEMLTATLMKILNDIGLGNEVNRKLVAVRAELKRAIHEMDARHITLVSDVFRRVDRIIG